MPSEPSIVLVSGEFPPKPFLQINFSSIPLFIHAEGKSLVSNGKLSILTVYDPSRNKIWLIDVKRISKAGFHFKPTTHGKSLQSLLEDAHIAKYFWDVRVDARVLWTQFQVKLDGVTDIQLLENASRKTNKTVLHDLDKSIHDVGGFTAQERQRWQRGPWPEQ